MTAVKLMSALRDVGSAMSPGCGTPFLTEVHIAGEDFLAEGLLHAFVPSNSSHIVCLMRNVGFEVLQRLIVVLGPVSSASCVCMRLASSLVAQVKTCLALASGLHESRYCHSGGKHDIPRRLART